MKDLIYGPINKSLHTQKFELLVKCILQKPDAIRYDVHKYSNGKDALFAEVGKTKINVSSLIQKINFNHLLFSKEDSEQYLKQTKSKDYKDNQEDKYSNLTAAEKSAIFKYTGIDYIKINSFLHGKTPSFDSSKADFNSSSSSLITNIGFLASGLNKIPPVTDCKITTFRGEGCISLEEVARRIECIESGDKIDMKPAFLSTSIDKSVSQVFSGGSFIEFEMPYGKDIAGLSKFQMESEYLLNPNYIFWDSYTVKNGAFHFTARIVAPLIEEENEIQIEELKELEGLINFAKTANIDLDFATPFNKENYIKPLTNSDLSLDAVLDSNDETFINTLPSQSKPPLEATHTLVTSPDTIPSIETDWFSQPQPLSDYELFENAFFLYM